MNKPIIILYILAFILILLEIVATYRQDHILFLIVTILSVGLFIFGKDYIFDEKK
jgi:hypothetical protein